MQRGKGRGVVMGDFPSSSMPQYLPTTRELGNRVKAGMRVEGRAGLTNGPRNGLGELSCAYSSAVSIMSTFSFSFPICFS